MKNKQLLITVLILAAVTAAITLFGISSSKLFRTNSEPFYTDDYVREDAYIGKGIPEIQDIGGNTLIAETRLAVEPSIGILPPYPYYGDDVLDVEDRAYQMSSNHSVVVNDVPDYLRAMKEYILSIDGRILNSSINSGDKYDSGSLYVKVPVEKFDEVTGRVTENVKKVVSENINASDVTGLLVGTTESLQNLNDQKSLKEAQLVDAKTELEKRRYQIEIERLERQITSTEKNLNSVEQKIEYASVSINAADSERYYNPDADGTIGETFERAWESLKEALKIGLHFGVWVFVYSLVWLPIILAFTWVFKRFKK